MLYIPMIFMQAYALVKVTCWLQGGVWEKGNGFAEMCNVPYMYTEAQSGHVLHAQRQISKPELNAKYFTASNIKARTQRQIFYSVKYQSQNSTPNILHLGTC